MQEKNFKTKVKDWWNKNKRVVKVGATCLAAGFCYGFIKGGLTVTKGMILLTSQQNPKTDDNFEYNESNVDDPELLELIRSEQESQSKGEES